MLSSLLKFAPQLCHSALVPSVVSAVSRLPKLSGQQARFLNLHEYQAKDVMRSFGVRVQNGEMASTPEKAREIAEKLRADGAADLICKAQILAGGRGKGTFTNGFKSGVHVLSEPAQVEAVASKMLGNTLVTKQTGPAGQKVQKVLVHSGVNFQRELYVALLLERTLDGPALVASPMGGMDIEEVARTTPEKIFTEPIDIMKGIKPHHTARMAQGLGFRPGSLQFTDACQQMERLYNMFVKCDCTMVEINPFVLATDGKVYCVDAKLGFDDSAKFRQKKLFEMRDTSQEDQREVAASKHDLNYIGLTGNIGCMVNGAGLAMSTMDLIQLHGGTPANFLDVGGSASAEQVKRAFEILSADSRVQAVFVNVFGGIMRCDVVAQGMINALRELPNMKIPVVVRFEGTNSEKGSQLLRESGLRFVTASGFDDGARKAVQCTGAKPRCESCDS